MGNGVTKQETKRYEEYLRSQFKNAKVATDRDFLVIQEVAAINPSEHIPVDLSHIAVLFYINSSGSGRFYLRQFIEFSQFCHKKQKNVNIEEFQSSILAFCSLHLWQEIKRGRKSLDNFVSWAIRALKENNYHLYSAQQNDATEENPISSCIKYENVDYLSRDNVRLLFRLLKIEEITEIKFDAFFNILQQSSEELGYLPLNETKLDPYVAVPTLHTFLTEFIETWIYSMESIGFEVEALS